MRLFHALVAICLLAGCATRMGALTPGDANYESVIWQDGRPALVSESEKYTALILPAAQVTPVGERLSFTLAVLNNSADPINLTQEDVSVTLGDGRNIKVMTDTDLAKEANRDVAWQRFAAALSNAGDAMSASAAATNTYSGTYSGTVNGRYVGGSYTGSTYDPAAAQYAQAQADRNAIARNNAVENYAAARLSSATLGGFKAQTILPGEKAATPLTLAKLPSGPQVINFVVSIGGTMRFFQYKYTPQ